jgi:hypothetical protein
MLVAVGHLVAVLIICHNAVFVFEEPLFYLAEASTYKNGGVGNLDMLKRSHKVLPVSGEEI